MSHIVDTVQELSSLLIVQVLPLASDNLNRVLRKKESAGRAVGTGKEWIAPSKDRSGDYTHHNLIHSFPVSGKDNSWPPYSYEGQDGQKVAETSSLKPWWPSQVCLHIH